MMQVRTGRIYEFDDFQLHADERRLLRHGEPVALHGKAFEMLLVLIKNRGRLLTKDELFAMVWPDQIVEESNLTVNMSAIRRALGERASAPRYVTTVSGRGYRFTGEVRETAHAYEELTIEQETFTRVVVEQEEDDASIADQDQRIADSRDEKSIRSMAFAHRALPDPRAEQLSAVSSSLGERKKSRQKMLAAGGLLCILLAAGGIGLGRYKEGQARRAASTVIPFQQIDIKRLTNLGNVANAALSPDGKLIVYSLTEKDGRRSLWLGHTEGGGTVQLRPPAEVVHLDLTFAPDGSSLYLIESENFLPGTLYRMPVFGGAAEKIKENISYVTFAPDGKRFAFVRRDDATRKSGLFIADTESANEQEITSRPIDLGFAAPSLAWSPDGSLIAVGAVSDESSRKEEVFVVGVADGSVRQLTSLAWTDVNAMAWLKDSSGLIVVAKETEAAVASQLWHVSYTDGLAHRIVADLNTYLSVLSLSADNDALLAVQGQGYANIWVAPSGELSQARQITFGTRNLGSYVGLDWTPDDRIVHTASVDQSRTIWATDVHGGNQRQLLPTGHINDNLSVTGDGRYIVFQSNRSGSFEVWRANGDGSDMRQLTTGGNNSQPHVSPDGQWVVYKSNRDDLGALRRVSIEGGESTRLTEKAASWPRVSPDGKLIACAYSADGKTTLAVVPTEGGPPVKVFDVPRLGVFGYGIRWTPDGRAVTYHDWANGIWKQSLDGGEPQRLEGLPEEKLFAHGWSRDGKFFAFVRGAQIRDVVLIRDSE